MHYKDEFSNLAMYQPFIKLSLLSQDELIKACYCNAFFFNEKFARQLLNSFKN